METKIKVFRMDDCMWYAAASLEEATRLYREETGIDDVSMAESPGYELTNEDMGQTMYVEHDLDDKHEPLTFARALELMVEKGKQFPCMFATTEW